MTHEIKQLIQSALVWQEAGIKAVLVTVVHLEGSSYRKPGVRMLISERGQSLGAISGGCVEKDIIRQARSVFQSGKSKMMTYDGRFRIGCEGVIYLLLEPIVVSDNLRRDFESVLINRQDFRVESYYFPEVGEHPGMGSVVFLNDKSYSLNPTFRAERGAEAECFQQDFPPVFQLYIFGAEHDAARLCMAAHLLGWEVTIVAAPDESKSAEFFPGAERLINPIFDKIDTSVLDEHTAVVLMSHSFQKDVQYLIALKDSKPRYLGLLGPMHRRERLLSEFMNRCPDVSLEFLEQLHGPAGINIGAESASEVALSILAEILSVIRRQKPISLREKKGAIHG